MDDPSGVGERIEDLQAALTALGDAVVRADLEGITATEAAVADAERALRDILVAAGPVMVDASRAAALQRSLSRCRRLGGSLLRLTAPHAVTREVALTYSPVGRPQPAGADGPLLAARG